LLHQLELKVNLGNLGKVQRSPELPLQLCLWLGLPEGEEEKGWEERKQPTWNQI
jgi:hypothetical protein